MKASTSTGEHHDFMDGYTSADDWSACHYCKAKGTLCRIVHPTATQRVYLMRLQRAVVLAA